MKHRMAFWTGLTVAAVATLAWGGFTMADDGSAYVIGNSTSTIVDSAATVSRELAQQPTHPYLIEYRRSPGCVVYLDPSVNYVRGKNGNPIDEHHFIVRAKQEAISANTPGVVIIHGGSQNNQMATRAPQPVFIISKPGSPGNGNDQGQPAMPSVPESTAPQKKLVIAQ